MAERVTISDVRNAGYCTRGARRWFETRGLDFKAFIREGIDRETFLSSGCPMAEDIVRKKESASHG